MTRLCFFRPGQVLGFASGEGLHRKTFGSTNGNCLSKRIFQTLRLSPFAETRTAFAEINIGLAALHVSIP